MNEPGNTAVNKKQDLKKNKTFSERDIDEVKRKDWAHRDKESMPKVKDRDILMLGDGAISDAKDERIH